MKDMTGYKQTSQMKSILKIVGSKESQEQELLSSWNQGSLPSRHVDVIIKGSSPNAIVKGFLWRLHHIGMIITNCANSPLPGDTAMVLIVQSS